MITTTQSRISYAGNGVSVTFAFPYLFYSNSHLIVTVTISGVDYVQVLDTNYTVVGVGSPSGGAITFLIAPASGATITIERIVPVKQEQDLINNDKFDSESLEKNLDKIVMMAQQLNSALNILLGDVAGGTFRISATGSIEIKNDTDNLYYRLGIQTSGGFTQLYVADTGHA